MARYRGQKSLYEAMIKTRDKPKPDSVVERLHSPEPKEVEPVPVKPSAPAPQDPPKPWRGPKAVQLNAGRIEISIPYQIGIALLLGFVLTILVAYRLGQVGQRGAGTPRSAEKTVINSRRADAPPGPTGVRGSGSAQSTGDRVIIIAQYGKRADLEPVRQHFAEYGIATRIVQRGSKYFLETKNTYDDPDKPGTNGYVARQRIIDVGAKYKGRAPQGYETFAPNFFKDAYSTKVK